MQTHMQSRLLTLSLKIIPLIFTLVFSLFLTACGTTEKNDETKAWPATKLYAEARDELAAGNYDKAIEYFEKLESRYPFGTYAQQAQMEVAYAYYRQNEQQQALAAVDRFIKLHPNHPNVDYLYYLRGLINFNDNKGPLDAFSNQDPTERDPKGTRESFNAFKELVDRFPNSVYRKDAIDRMKYLVNAMAQYEVHVANYYYRRGAYLSAVNRAQTAVKNYREAPAIEEALSIMVKSYDALGLNELRDDAERVLKKNFPDSPFLTGTPANDSKTSKKFWMFWK